MNNILDDIFDKIIQINKIFFYLNNKDYIFNDIISLK